MEKSNGTTPQPAPEGEQTGGKEWIKPMSLSTRRITARERRRQCLLEPNTLRRLDRRTGRAINPAAPDHAGACGAAFLIPFPF